MPVVRATAIGDFARALDAEVREVEGAMRRAITTTGQQVQAELRAQARSAGFRDGGRAVANTWRLTIYPGAGRRTLHPAALVWSKMPDVVRAFDQGAVVRPKNGGERLAIPTKYNIARMRSSGKREPIVSIKQMVSFSDERPPRAKIAPARLNKEVLVWYIRTNRVSKNSSFARKSWIERKYMAGAIRLSSKGIERVWVPMFVLIKPFKLRKRLSIDEVRGRAPGMLARAVAAELAAVA